MSRCYVIGAGEFDPCVLPREGDYIIAADAGLSELTARGITPHEIVGDFDSLGTVPEGENVTRHPVMKDDTDLALAVGQGLAHGCDCFVLNGTLGGRLDHSLANIQLLRRLAEQGVRAVLTGKNERLTAVRNGAVRFDPSARGTVSVFCLGDRADGVWERGLLYSLTDATLTGDRALGVSNEFTGVGAEISVRDGTLLVVWQDGIDKLLED